MIPLSLPLAALLACAPPDRDWSPHRDAVADHEAGVAPLAGPRPPPYSPLRQPGDTPDVTVYGYWPYWGDPIAEMPWDQLTHLAIFDVGLQADGSLSDTARWHDNAAEALALGAPWDVKVHVCVTSFSDSVMNTVLPSPALRANAIAALADLVATYGADGVNVDFEGLDAAQKQNFVDFIVELKQAVPEVFLATPAIDWQGAYDYDLLALGSDGLFIMGYGYHWSGGDPGPPSPLYGSALWGPYSLDWSLGDYRTWGAPDGRIVMGLPLYGRHWETVNNDIPGESVGQSWAEVYTSAVALGQQHGAQYDPASHTRYTFEDPTSQLWYDDAQTLEAKIAWAVAEGIQGVGFWAMTYEDADPDLWSRVDALTHAGLSLSLPDPGVANADNILWVRGAEPGATVHLVVGVNPGATQVPGCPAAVDIANPIYLGSAVADAQGVATFTVAVPPNAAGRTGIFQAADRDDCLVSNAVAFPFPFP